MRAWILGNLKVIKNVLMALSVVLSVVWVYWTHNKIKSLNSEISRLQLQNSILSANLERKSVELNALSQNCIQKELIDSEISEIKGQILNDYSSTASNKNGVDESLKKAGEFISARVKK